MDVKRLVERLTREARVTVLTGAGVSAASGVPTFRGADGLWKNFRPETLATAEAFGRDPKLVWEWYAWRRSRIAACDPNPAHRVLAEWSRRFPNFRLITQNVDGLHESAFAKASTSAKASADKTAGQGHASDVIRLHGSIWEVSCWEGCAKAPKRWRDETLSFDELPPRCPHCGGLIRPGVVWFGETLDPAVVRKASQAAECDVFITIGTSAIVYPAAGFLAAAKQHGAFTAEINPEATPATSTVDLALMGGAERILPEIDALLPAV
jgi:NAD-dependent protein deacetylase/lipoamidase